MRLNLSIAIITCLFLFGSNQKSYAQKKKKSTSDRPNIIFILTDDQRWSALGYSGNKLATTPEMDKLAESGVYGWGPYATTKYYMDKLAGLGDVDWKKYIGALYEAGYKGVICIEHEDRDWEKDEDTIKRGVLLAQKLLSRYLL